MPRQAWRIALVLFVCAAAYVWWIAGARFSLALNDEGIYFDAGLRVLDGQAPYKDFFALTGPGTLLLEALSFRVFGATLAAARAPVVFDIALLTACLFWLAMRLGVTGMGAMGMGATRGSRADQARAEQGRERTPNAPARPPSEYAADISASTGPRQVQGSATVAAAIGALTFLAFSTAGESTVIANHRWDSAAWAVLAVALIVAIFDQAEQDRDEQYGDERDRSGESAWIARTNLLALGAGFSAGMAAWCTPPVALVAIVLAICLGLFRETRRALIAYAGGVTAMFALVALWLAAHGALRPMISALEWSASNYSSANHVPYGWVTGGYANLLRGISAAELPVTLLILLFLTLPATLPLAGAISVWKRPSREAALLFAAGVALIASTYPRWDLNHLQCVAAPFYALAIPLAWRSFPRKAGLALGAIALVASVSSLGVATLGRMREPSRTNALGRIHGSPQDLDAIERLQARIGPGDTLFVFPYRPLLYFATGARNPTRYSFLQPGMFPLSDEQQALAQLQGRPPEWVAYMDVPPEAYLRIWPGSDPRRLRMSAIENFLHQGYEDTGSAPAADVRLLRRRKAAPDHAALEP